MVCAALKIAAIRKAPIIANATPAIGCIVAPNKKQGIIKTIMARNWMSPKLKVAPRLSPHFCLIICAERLNAAIGPRFS